MLHDRIYCRLGCVRWHAAYYSVFLNKLVLLYIFVLYWFMESIILINWAINWWCLCGCCIYLRDKRSEIYAYFFFISTGSIYHYLLIILSILITSWTCTKRILVWKNLMFNIFKCIFVVLFVLLLSLPCPWTFLYSYVLRICVNFLYKEFMCVCIRLSHIIRI